MLKFRASDLQRMLQEMEQRILAYVTQVVAQFGTTRYVPVVWDGIISAEQKGQALQTILPEGFTWPLSTVGIAIAEDGGIQVFASAETTIQYNTAAQMFWVNAVQLAPLPSTESVISLQETLD